MENNNSVKIMNLGKKWKKMIENAVPIILSTNKCSKRIKIFSFQTKLLGERLLKKNKIPGR